MARSGGSVRMGPISLFTLVITLCLAVMAMLAYTTAQAERSLTLRQANATTDLYTNETAAQEFLALLDSQLVGLQDSYEADDPDAVEEAVQWAADATGRAADEDGASAASNGKRTASATASNDAWAKDRQASNTGSTTSQQDSDTAANEAPVDPFANAPEVINIFTLAPAEALQTAGVVGAIDTDNAVLGVHGEFTTDNGRLLDIVLMIRDDGTYEILCWKATTVWEDQGSGETLWTGSAGNPNNE